MLIRYVGGPVVGSTMLAIGYAPDAYRLAVMWLALAVMTVLWARAVRDLQASDARALAHQRIIIDQGLAVLQQSDQHQSLPSSNSD